MKTASIYVQKVGVVLSDTMSPVNVSDARKTPCPKGRCKDVT